MDANKKSRLSDDALKTLLDEAGVAMTPAELRALLAGVNAAPEAENPDAWMALAGNPAPGSALAQALGRLREEMRPAPDETPLDKRVAALRAELKSRGLDGFLVPHADEYMGEYLPPGAERLAWISGFDGSAGAAIVMADRAAIFVDGRYTLQVRDQAPEAIWEYRHLVTQPQAEWLADNVGKGQKIGYDPRLHTARQLEALRKAAEKAGASLVPVADNPLDKVWKARPPAPVSPVVVHPLSRAGEEAADKRRRLAATLKEEGTGAAVLTMPESICWLLNIRGGDIPNTPFALSTAILHDDGTVDLFIDPRKLTRDVRSHLGGDVRLHDPAAWADALKALGQRGIAVALDPATAPALVSETVEAAGGEIVWQRDPCMLPKAIKNETELQGMRDAHLTDAVAVTRFLAWLDRFAGAGHVTEMQAVERLRAFRREGEGFMGPSFDTIAGSGPNGAIVHYRVTEDSDRTLSPGELFLCDSGGQYRAGTTDITRTVPVGKPDDGMRRAFTLVLKGHIALAMARFPAGTSGAQLDALARQYLWAEGMNYDHGTGHGVGSYLSVHEGPQGISSRSTEPLKPGMILSNEPGFYKAGAWGIRIENLVAVVETDSGDDGREMLGFETLTLVPIDRRLIDMSLMEAREIAWLDGYHARIRDVLGHRLEGADRAFLEAMTAPLDTGDGASASTAGDGARPPRRADALQP